MEDLKSKYNYQAIKLGKTRQAILGKARQLGVRCKWNMNQFGKRLH